LKEELLRRIPKVDAFLSDRDLTGRFPTAPLSLVKEAVRLVLDRVRKKVIEGKRTSVDYEALKEEVAEELSRLLRPKLCRLINATGVVLHTNLGRAPVSEKVAEHLKQVITGYSNLEYDLEAGRRGLRYRNVEWLFKFITGAEDVCVVNNNAGAVLLVLSALAKGKEVIVSRGELIEIGGSFRMPEVMLQSGAILKEVGTTNKTKLSDYEDAIGENTALLLKVHTSNYRILGFTESVSSAELAQLGRKYGIPVYEDLGSGSLIDPRSLNLSYEPTVQDVLKSGVDVVSFSGDKLLGSAQAGIILGKKELLSKIKKHPLNRALRVDKMTLAVLEMTLMHYLDRDKALEEVPVWKLLSQPLSLLNSRAQRLLELVTPHDIKAELFTVRENSEVGGGALPLQRLPTVCVGVKPFEISVSELDRRLRRAVPPVVGRIKEETYLLDMRTVFDHEVQPLARNLVKVLSL
jgi:L-seryl-tRNA(Ser) seleniumtransferase